MFDFLDYIHTEAGIPQNLGKDFNVNSSDLDVSHPNTNNPANNPHNQSGLEINTTDVSGHSNLLGDNWNSYIDCNGNTLLSHDTGNLISSNHGNLVGRNYDSLVEHNFSDIVHQNYGSLINRPLGKMFVSHIPSSDGQVASAFENGTSSNDSSIQINESSNRTIVHSPTGFNKESGNPGFGVSREEYEAQERKLDDLKSKLESAKSREEDKKDKVELCASNVKSALRRWENAPLDDSKIRYKNTLELNEKWYDDAVRSYKYAHEEVEKLSDQVASLSSTVRDLKNKIDK